MTGFFGLLTTLAMAAPRDGGGGEESPPFFVSLMPIILMVVIFYFLLIRPQQKKAKEHQELLKKVKVGDKVVTSSGIIGVIVSLKEKSVALRSADTKMEVQKSAIAEITEQASSESES